MGEGNGMGMGMGIQTMHTQFIIHVMLLVRCMLYLSGLGRVGHGMAGLGRAWQGRALAASYGSSCIVWL